MLRAAKHKRASPPREPGHSRGRWDGALQGFFQVEGVKVEPHVPGFSN